MSLDGGKKFGFVTVDGRGPETLFATTYTALKLSLGEPNIAQAAKLIKYQDEAIGISPGKGFSTVAFNNPNKPNALTMAKYLMDSLNGARPKGMFESIASTNGTAVQVNIDALRQAIKAYKPTDITWHHLNDIADLLEGKAQAIKPVQEKNDKPFVTRVSRRAESKGHVAALAARNEDGDEHYRGGY